jgi:hypothetical protein
MQRITLENMPGTTISILETPIDGYVVGVIKISESLKTEEAHTSQDWHDALSAGGFGLPHMLQQLWYAATDRRRELSLAYSLESGKSLPVDLTPMDESRVEFFEVLMGEIAGARQDVMCGGATCLHAADAQPTA